MKEPSPRPENVPVEATWNKKDKEWELGKKKGEDQVGTWHWWAKEGHLTCTAEFTRGGNLKSYIHYRGVRTC